MTLQFHLDGQILGSTSEVRSHCTPCKQGSSQVGRTPKDGRLVLFTALDPTSDEIDEECEDLTIQNLADTLITQSRTESMIIDLKRTGEFKASSEESQKTIARFGKIELFD